MRRLHPLCGSICFLWPLLLTAQGTSAFTERYVQTEDTLGRPRHLRIVQVVDTPAVAPAPLTPGGILRVRKGRPFIYRGFQPGDTLALTVRHPAGQELREAVLLSARGDTLRAVANWPELTATYVVPPPDSGQAPDSLVRLFVRGKFNILNPFARKYAAVEAVRRPRGEARAYLVFYDTVFRRETVPREVSRDTTLVLLADDSLRVANQLDPLNPAWGWKSVEVPSENKTLGRLTQLTYWIGIGEQAIAAYRTLELETGGAPPGMPPLLAAFALGRQKLLPGPAPDLVDFTFTSTAGIRQFHRIRRLDAGVPRLMPARGRPAHYRNVPAAEIFDRWPVEVNPRDGTTFRTLHIPFYNADTVRSFTIQVKVLGAYVLSAYESTEHMQILEATTYRKPLHP